MKHTVPSQAFDGLIDCLVDMTQELVSKYLLSVNQMVTGKFVR